MLAIMEAPKENLVTTLTEVDIGNSAESFQKFLDSQKDLFHSQVDQLQRIVDTQCKLTGVNPLSQEMAAGALSINIGKRPRDLLNPKAAKYMQSIFSIKDTLTKKETREISAYCGVTLTQVREFFAGQRSRVRKVVRLSREKAIMSDAGNTSQDGYSPSSDLSMPINPVPLNTVDPKTVEASPSCSTQEETIPGVDDHDKNFITNIFTLMRKEGTFSGEVKLMEWMLQIQNAAVLCWFVNKGGLMILTAWLSQAALEEQTTVLLVILKVLCHLPLHKALPVQMSAILQTVNRLRFYRTSDISNRAKVLLSKWSKLFVRSQALKRPPPNSSISAQKEKNLNQGEYLSNEWQSNIDLPEEILSIALESTENCRKPEPSTPLKLLQASPDDSNKKRGVAPIQTRERRKVLPMEEPDRNTTGRGPQVARIVPSNQSRPMSADDIQKAKMRAMHMQSKYGKIGASPNENQKHKTEDSNKSATPPSNFLRSALKHPVRPKIEEDKKPTILALENSPTPPTVPTGQKPAILVSEPSPTLPTVPTGKKQDILASETSLTPLTVPTGKQPAILASEISPTPPTVPTDKKPAILASETPCTPPTVPTGNKPAILASENSPTPPTIPMDKKPAIFALETSPNLPTVSMDSKPRVSTQQSLMEKLKSNQIPWHSPPEVRINSLNGPLKVGEGENSKEVEIQIGRMRREKETIYQSVQDIPPNPKEPWDLEMDYDDSLTPEIPIEQAPDPDGAEALSSPRGPEVALSSPYNGTEAISVPRVVENTPQTSVAATTAVPIIAECVPTPSVPEPDFELLAVLLKNPELVFALTSGQSNNLSSAETMKLLDMIKQNGAGLAGILNGFQANTKREEIVTSLPSPTPPTRSFPSPTPPTRSFPSPTPPAERLMNGWSSEAAAMDQFSRSVPATNREICGFTQAAPAVQFQEQLAQLAANRDAYGFAQPLPALQLQEQHSASMSMQSYNQRSNFPSAQLATAAGTPQQQHPVYRNIHSGYDPHSNPTPALQPTLSERQYMSPMNPSTTNHSQHNFLAASVPQRSVQPELVSYAQMQAIKPAPITITLNTANGAPITIPSLPNSSHTSLPEPSFSQPTTQWNSVGNSRHTQMTTNSWSHGNQNSYHRGGSVQNQPLRANPSWERNEYVVGEPEFESWSPENSPVRRSRSRSPGYHYGRNYSQPRRDSSRSSRPDWSRRPRDYGRRDYRQEDYRQGSSRWRDQRY